jgi:S-adenosylmethionine-diacylglycerol 3-amino-3-carboxypropyl transferase
MNNRFFEQVNYSASTEDGQAEITALELKPTDRVLCITGSGARTLDLLLANPGSIVSLDFSAPQNHLLELKMVAYRYLTYAEFRILMGLEGSSSSLKLFESIEKYLSPNSHGFWERNRDCIRKGVLYCGTWEKILRFLSYTKYLRTYHVDGLLEATDLPTQMAYWKKHWTGFFFKNYLRLLSNRFLWVKVIREPGARLIAPDFDVAGYLLDCLQRMANHSLLRENPYANLLFYGRYTNRCRLPLHLQLEHFETIRARIDRIEIQTGELASYLRESEDSFDAYSLSDFSSYATPENYDQAWQAIIASARKHSRYCERFFLVHREPPKEALLRNKELENILRSIDHTCMYTFHAGSIDRNQNSWSGTGSIHEC